MWQSSLYLLAEFHRLGLQGWRMTQHFFRRRNSIDVLRVIRLEDAYQSFDSRLGVCPSNQTSFSFTSRHYRPAALVDQLYATARLALCFGLDP